MKKYHSPNSEPPPPLDDKEFNDPEAWGFCRWCAFEVAVYEGKMVKHPRQRNLEWEDTGPPCRGSGGVPEATPTEAESFPVVNFRKDPRRAASVAYWQRQRWYHREKARKISLLKKDGIVIGWDGKPVKLNRSSP